MRRNLENRKSLGGVKVEYEISGLNQDRLISELKKRDITLYDVKKFSNKLMHISVNLRESENFFAISKNLWYNVKKVRLYGKGLPVYKLLKNLGLALGAFLFLVVAVISNDFVFDFNYSGSGSVYARQVSEYLSERGITKFSRFSSFKTERLEDEILADMPGLTFVSVTKNGNTLDVYMTLKAEGVNTVGGRAKQLISSEAGVVESIKIYRGTALVNVGDSVKEGDLLAEGYAEIKEQRVETGIIACFTLLQERTFTYRLEGLKKEQIALSLADEEFADKEIVESRVTVKEISGGENLFEYTVVATYRCVIYAK